MAPTKITWEEVQSYTRVSSRYNVYENNGQYYFVTEEGGMMLSGMKVQQDLN